MFSFTRSRSRLRIKNSQSRSRLRNPAVLQCFLLYNFFIPRLQNWFLLLTRFSVRAIPFHQTGARRRLCCPRDIFLEHVIGSDFALLSINQSITSVIELTNQPIITNQPISINKLHFQSINQLTCGGRSAGVAAVATGTVPYSTSVGYRADPPPPLQIRSTSSD